jgi:hypothetical protein
LGFFQVFYAIFRDFLGFWDSGFSKILGFFQIFFGIFDEVYEDFPSNLPLGPATNQLTKPANYNQLADSMVTAVVQCEKINPLSDSTLHLTSKIVWH